MNKDIRMQNISNFQQAHLNSYLVQCLQKCGFTRPTPIQYHSIISFSQYPEHNIIAQSKSGTGKTLSFLTPILNDICLNGQIKKQTICLIILPTRQLSVQVHQYLKQILNTTNEVKSNAHQRQFKNTLKNISSLLTIGGIPIQDDKKTLLTSGANFVIGTIGRVYQLFQTGYLKADFLKYVIFDEGDKLFETKDQKLEKILKKIQISMKFNTEKQKKKVRFFVYSATFSKKSMIKLTQRLSKLLKSSSEFLHQPKFLYIQTLSHSNSSQQIQIVTQNLSQLNFVTFLQRQNQDQKTEKIDSNSFKKVQITNSQNNLQLISLQNIKKYWVETKNDNTSLLVRKCDALKQILQGLEYKKCLIFVQKKALLQQIYDQIKEFQPLLIHGSMSQASRIKVMNQANKAKIIISSDLLARGIDLVLDLVILYDAHMNQTFWHRIGRTGRFGRVGVVISFDKIQQWKKYDRNQINQILKEAIVEESTVKKKQWYGTYMTEYGQWQQVNNDKQQILNKGYNFFSEIMQDQNPEQSKKMKKEIKIRQKQQIKNKQCKNKQSQDLSLAYNYENKIQLSSKVLNNCNFSAHTKKENIDHQIKSEFNSQKQFINYYAQLFKCEHCFNLINELSAFSANSQLQLIKYFKHFDK